MAGGHHLQQVYTDPSAGEFGEQTFLGGMSLGGRVRLFLVLGLIALAALGTGYYMVDRMVGAAANDLADARDVAALTDKVEKGIWGLRVDERSFLAGRQTSHMEHYDMQVEAMTAALDQLFARSSAAAVKDHVTAIHEGLARHAGAFREIAGAIKLMESSGGNGVAGLLSRASEEIESRLQATKAPGLMNLVARLRAEERAVLESGDTEAIGRLRKHLEALTLAVDGFLLPAADKRGVSELIAAYRTAIEAAAEARSIEAEGVTRLDAVYARMEPHVAALLSFAEERLVVATEKERELHAMVRPVVAGGTAGAVLLVLLFGIMLMRSVTNPVRALASMAPRLLGGDESAAVPALGNHDEIGEVARALARLRTDAGEAPRLRKDLDAAKADVARHIEEAGRQRDEAESLRARLRKAEEEAAAPAMLPPVPEPPPEPAQPAAPPPPLPDVIEDGSRLGKLWSGSISSIGETVALSSRDVSDAAFEAERTGTMIRGLNTSAGKLKEVEGLMAAISEQANFLAYKGTVQEEIPGEETNRNLVVLSAEYRAAMEKGGEAGTSANRLEIVQTAANQASRTIKEVGETLLEIKDAALDMATVTSEEALAVTNRLMEQSEQLRAMLDSLMGTIQSRDTQLLDEETPRLPERKDKGA